MMGPYGGGLKGVVYKAREHWHLPSNLIVHDLIGPKIDYLYLNTTVHFKSFFFRNNE